MPKERTPYAEILVARPSLRDQIKGTGSNANRKSDTMAKTDSAYEDSRAPGAQEPPLIV